MPKQDLLFDDRRQGLIRVLLYPVMFEKNPLNAIDRVLKMVADQKPLNATPAAYLSAIRAALATETSLANIVPQGPPDQDIRRFLSELAHRLDGPPNPKENND